MELLNLFKRINKKGIKLTAKNGALNVKANTKIDPELLLEIKANKAAIIEYLEKYDEKNISESLLAKYQSGTINKALYAVLHAVSPLAEDSKTKLAYSNHHEAERQKEDGIPNFPVVGL